MSKFKKDDLVTCNESSEIEQPMKIIGLNPWFDSSMKIYYVAGKHKRNGNEIVVTLSEGILNSYVGQ